MYVIPSVTKLMDIWKQSGSPSDVKKYLDKVHFLTSGESVKIFYYYVAILVDINLTKIIHEYDNSAHYVKFAHISAGAMIAVCEAETMTAIHVSPDNQIITSKVEIATAIKLFLDIFPNSDVMALESACIKSNAKAVRALFDTNLSLNQNNIDFIFECCAYDFTMISLIVNNISLKDVSIEIRLRVLNMLLKWPKQDIIRLLLENGVLVNMAPDILRDYKFDI